MRQYLAPKEGLDNARLDQWHRLGVAQVAVGLVFDDAGLVADKNGETPAQRIGLGLARLMDAADHGCAVLADPAIVLERFDFLWIIGAMRIDAAGAQRPLDRDLPIAELGVVEDL